MGLPKTPIIAIVSQIFAFIFAIILIIPGQNGQLEDTYILSINTSRWGHDAMKNSKMFALNNSNPMFAVMTSVHLDLEHFEATRALKGLNDAIMSRLDINMSDPQTINGIYNTPLKDAISGGKDLINGARGQFNIANGIADFLKGMAAQMSGQIPAHGPVQNNQTATVAPHAPMSNTTTQQLNSLVAPNNDIHLSKRGDPFGPPKPQPPIPAEGPWTPLRQVLQTQGPTISSGLKHGAIKSMNAGMTTFRQTFPIYDFYSIYNAAICWGFYKPDNPKPQTVGCGSSADWKDIDTTPHIQRMVKLISPDAQIVGPNGLGANMERFLGTTRILLMIMYISKIMTIVNLGLSMVGSIVGIAVAFGGCLPTRFQGKLVFINFTLSASAAGTVVPNTMGVLMMLGGMGITMPPMNAMMSIDMKLGVKFLMLSVIDMLFAIAGTVAWFKMWRTMVKMEASKREASAEHGPVEVINVGPNKYEA